MEINKSSNYFIIKLKSDNLSKETFLGIIVLLLMNKSIFVKNSYVSEFIEGIFDFKVPYYATKSRTLMVAKICRIIIGLDDKKIILSHKKALSYLNEMLDSDVDRNIHNKKKSKNSLSNMNKWMGGILDKNG
ncbi:hypothetical protein [Vibrio sp. AND4]|uniref:hypothetical protein n=1 Tax=Vibrio sp. AND4 TaxID=314289 RepID=UPI00015EFF58|nr:hypothetical protein [Vibrio sp. AND4]EDP59469.1 hypothetical protein AND4_09857 [Vibrio sp. AND4]